MDFFHVLSLDLSVGPVQLGKWNKLEIALILGNTGVPVLLWGLPRDFKCWKLSVTSRNREISFLICAGRATPRGSFSIKCWKLSETSRTISFWLRTVTSQTTFLKCWKWSKTSRNTEISFGGSGCGAGLG